MAGVWLSMQPPLPFRFPPLPHQQFHFLPLQSNQQPQQGLDFRNDQIGHAHAARMVWWLLGASQTNPQVA